MPTPNEVVDALLVRSLEQHRAALYARNKRLLTAFALLVVAANLRKDALQLDPGQQLPAWQDEERRLQPGIHAKLLAFYVKKIPGFTP